MIGRRFTLASVAAIALLAAACSSSGGATPSPTATAAPPSVAPSSAAASPSASAEESPSASSASSDYPLAVATVSAGKTLTGEDGKTLYIFKADTKDSGKSTCNADGGCAANWPPYTLEADETLAPTADATGTVTMITRDDGTKQVAYNGWPLYYYAGDKAAGDSNGQGLFDKWFIAAP